MAAFPGWIIGIVCVLFGVVLIVFRAKISDVALRANESVTSWDYKRTKSAEVPVWIIAIALIFFGGVAFVYALVS